MKLLYIGIGAAIGIYLFKKFMIASADYKGLMAKGAIVIDVRSPQEYDNGHINGSLNIPLGIITQRAADIKAKNVPVICVCASGMRSGNASAILKKNGIESYNGGNWSVLNRKIS
jgi:rhodanese-related sulfurtransferase